MRREDLTTVADEAESGGVRAAVLGIEPLPENIARSIGLTGTEAAKRLASDGENRMPDVATHPPSMRRPR
jgi:hypothetical protein